MEIKVNMKNDNLIISLIGRLDTMTSQKFEEKIKSISFDEIRNITINMKELEYVASAGLRVILMLNKKIIKNGGKLKIINANNVIKELFTMVGMDDYLEIEQA
ncbi:STAS domain-containing protein [Clostridium sp. HCP1S3_B4]|uniref:STAS domain-containing protein n=1 Tax=unclassified Clostridium TaxID=2614128 RepID=UPI0016A4DE61|nr:STAS domain-containing protein [Clostridiales bacterium]MDY2729533.1 STAS domain-containing protein [Clostridium sp.]NLK24865.1 STAS domain-containing protein [Clostridiales bacterium]